MPRPDVKAVQANWKSLCLHVNNMERCLLQLCAHPETDPVDLAHAINKYRATLRMMQETLLELQTKVPPAPWQPAWEFNSISGRAWRVQRHDATTRRTNETTS